MSARQRDVSADELDEARAILGWAKAHGTPADQDRAMEGLAILRSAYREQFAEAGLHPGDTGVRIHNADGTLIVASVNHQTVFVTDPPEEG